MVRPEERLVYPLAVGLHDSAAAVSMLWRQPAVSSAHSTLCILRYCQGGFVRLLVKLVARADRLSRNSVPVSRPPAALCRQRKTAWQPPLLAWPLAWDLLKTPRATEAPPHPGEQRQHQPSCYAALLHTRTRSKPRAASQGGGDEATSVRGPHPRRPLRRSGPPLQTGCGDWAGVMSCCRATATTGGSARPSGAAQAATSGGCARRSNSW